MSDQPGTHPIDQVLAAGAELCRCSLELEAVATAIGHADAAASAYRVAMTRGAPELPAVREAAEALMRHQQSVRAAFGQAVASAYRTISQADFSGNHRVGRLAEEALRIIPCDIVDGAVFRGLWAVMEPSLREEFGLPFSGKKPIHLNSLQLTGAVWHVRYEGGEEGDFLDRDDSVFRHLARLLAEPCRRFLATDFCPPPAGAAEVPHYGRDEASDGEAMADYQRRLRHLAGQIKEAEDAHNAETAGKLRVEFGSLAEHVRKDAPQRGHRKLCGISSPAEKANQRLRVGLSSLQKRLEKSGLTKLAEHLDNCIDNSNGEWVYVPPPGTSPWHIASSDTSKK